MTLERIDRLTAPPVVGRSYFVPTVRGQWIGKVADWPVMGELHDDKQFFRFPEQHFHLDRRFLPNRWLEDAIHWPLHGRPNLPGLAVLPVPIWRRRKCLRTAMGFPVLASRVREMQAHLAGAQCRPSPAGGWTCPHRLFDLASIAPNESGIITCPLHGLRVRAATGEVVAP